MTPREPNDPGLVADVQYLNLEETGSFCRRHGLPRYIVIERSDGTRRRTRDRDRKDVVLQRILDLALRGERTGPTVYAHVVVDDSPCRSD